jgi:hypothetical protein
MTGLPDDPAGFVEEMNARDESRTRALSSASGDTIVADWETADEKGVEYWRFDAAGDVYEHRVYSRPNVEPVEGPLDRLRTAAAYPLSALAFLRAKRRR